VGTWGTSCSDKVARAWS